MYIVAFALPPIAMIIALLCGADTGYWWAYLLITLAAEGVIYLVFHFQTTSTEYLSGYVTSVTHHFAWVERREITETKYDSEGKSYTVKRIEHIKHPDEYFWALNTGKSFTITSNAFHRMCKRWGTEIERISVYHPNCVSGGDGEACYWDGDEYNTQTVTYTHRYYNPVKNSNSVFRGQRISRIEAKKLGLFDYPKTSGWEQDVLLVSKGVKHRSDYDEAAYELKHLNAFCGLRNEIHVFIILFPASAGVGIALKQRDYWEGCNKNEFVVCLGIEGDKVEWCHTLSWMDKPELDVKVKEYFIHHNKVQLKLFVIWLRNHLYLWKRKEFSDFKYLGWQMSQSGSTLFWAIVLALTIVVLFCSFWIG